MKYEKLAAGLTSLLDTLQQEGEIGLQPSLASIGVISNLASPNPPRITVSIDCDENADFSHLEEHGIIVNQPSGTIRTAFLPLESIQHLAEEDAVKYITPARYSKLTMDIASRDSKVNLSSLLSGNPGLTGRGVIIGIVDTGIDPNHPAFLGRVVSIWDQTVHGGSGIPGIGGYGVELQGSAITQSRDTYGHGTHVAGIAAGSDPSSPYRGVASEAKLVIVKTDLNNDHIVDGVRYVFAKASQMGLPAVVNLSLRDHANPHDGTDVHSRAIDQMTGSGRIVCAAAGNDSLARLHAEIPITGFTESVFFNIPRSGSISGSGVVTISLHGWYSKNAQVEVSVGVGAETTPFQKIISSGNPSQRYSLGVDYDVEIVTPPPNNMIGGGDNNFLVNIRARNSTSTTPIPLVGGICKLKVRGIDGSTGVVDVWVTDDSSTQDIQFVLPSNILTDKHKIGFPGAAKQSVTVASYTTRNSWPPRNESAPLPVGTISSFSSPGPLRNQEQKPDVSAPGAFIVSARSRDIENNSPELFVNDKYMANAGTSMATPFVVGVVALLLQQDRNLTPDQVKLKLRGASFIPGQTSGTFDPKWGFGVVDTSRLPFSISSPAAIITSEASHAHFCFDQVLTSWEMVVKAAELAIAENPANHPLVSHRRATGSSPVDAEIAMALFTGKKWANGRTLKIRFLEGDPVLQNKVISHAKKWSDFANINFDFGDHADAEIRIAFMLGKGSWSAMGTEALLYPREQPTMNFGWLTPTSSDNDIQEVVLHEFGHALGCIHEHQHPSAGIPWDRAAVTRELSGPPNNWDPEKIQFNVFDRYTASQTQFSQFDTQSIMGYFVPRQWTTNGFHMEPGSVLSSTDKDFISIAYPRNARIIPLTIDATPLSASIGSVGEEDFYSFSVTTSGAYTIETFGATDVVTSLFEAGDPRTLIAEDDDSGQDRNSKVFASLAPGNYQIMVRHFDRSSMGDYSISIRRS